MKKYGEMLHLADWSAGERERLNAVLAERDRQMLAGERPDVTPAYSRFALAQRARRQREKEERCSTGSK